MLYEFVQRFLPSEFGIDPARMENALEPGRVTFDEKMVVRRAIQEAKIPFTYVSANCFAGYFAGNLSQMVTLLPPKEKVCIYGDGNVKGTCLVRVTSLFDKFSIDKRVTLIYTQLFFNYMHAVVFMDEDDIATYTIKTIDDPRTINKTVYLRPPENILTQRQLVEIWEKLAGKQLEKVHIPNDQFLATMKGI